MVGMKIMKDKMLRASFFPSSIDFLLKKAVKSDF